MGGETLSSRWYRVLGGGGGTPNNGLYGEAPPERGTFFRLEVYKRVGILKRVPFSHSMEGIRKG